MPPHGLYGQTRGVKWSDELQGFVMKCNDCERKGHQSYWLLTTEFWKPGSLQRCRACNLEKKRNDSRRRTREDSEYAQRRREYAKQYYAENKEVVLMKHTDYMREYRKRQRGAA